MLSSKHQAVAKRIFGKGAFKFGAFRLKLHDINPDAPLSPFYIDLRDKDNPKPGPLDASDYDLIVLSILETIREADIVFDAIAGIPNAGTPIINALARLMEKSSALSQGDFRVIELKKVEVDGKRKIVPMPGFEYKAGERILLVDDLITQADTKLEAIAAVEGSGSVVAGVVVLVDRMQGGREQLEKAGYKLLASFTVKDLFDFYLVEKMISAEKYSESWEYVQSQQKAV